MSEFENYFYKLSIPSIKQNKDIHINFNKNYFKKLTTSYAKFIKYHNIEDIINSLINFDRKYKNWDQINKSIILSIFSELEITNKEKAKIVINDYINISKNMFQNRFI